VVQEVAPELGGRGGGEGEEFPEAVELAPDGEEGGESWQEGGGREGSERQRKGERRSVKWGGSKSGRSSSCPRRSPAALVSSASTLATRSLSSASDVRFGTHRLAAGTFGSSGPTSLASCAVSCGADTREASCRSRERRRGGREGGRKSGSADRDSGRIRGGRETSAGG
jgi:hypothetical protein